DVLVEADGAYDQKASQGRMSRIRRAMRHFGENAQNAKFYIALLPSEDNYLSSLTGGLKFICAAAERIGKIRKSVADALEELPTILSEKGQLLELLDKRYTTEQLHRRNADFSAATLLNLRWTMEEEEQDRAVALMQNESVREWIRTPESSALLVHGNGTNSVNSPASFVSAKLFESLCMESEDSSAIIPLAFFCGLHTDKGSDFDTYPSGLALNFLLQLVEHKVLRDHDAESTRLAALTSNVDVNEVTSWSMLELLVHVVQQLPPDLVVFFIVDAVNYYEESSRLDETMEFVDGMHELVEGQKGPVVKVLFTSPAGTIAIWETFRSRRGNGGPKVIRMNGSYSMQGGFKRLGWEEF
ncbi:hypothetical protein K490DRAFT_49882, partial [Saccharata proteae CBS 121410]